MIPNLFSPGKTSKHRLQQPWLLAFGIMLILYSKGIQDVEGSRHDTGRSRQGIVRRYEVQGLAGGDPVTLPCEVDESHCGGFHNIKWYKDTERVYVFSERDNFMRAEGSLTGRTNFNFKSDRVKNYLEIFPLATSDEGTYRCEITYMVVKEYCSIVQFTNLTTFAVPTYRRMTFRDGSPIDNGTTIGPFDEGTPLELKCESGGGKPIPEVSWWNDTTQLTGDYIGVLNGNDTGTGLNTLRFTVGRGDLSSRGLYCQVENEAMKTPSRLHIKLNVNVAPESVTVRQLQSPEIKEGSLVTLRCDVRGARPAASISWYNGSVPIEHAVTLDNIQEDTGKTKEHDGTFSTWSQLQFKGTRFENQKTFSCHASNSVLEKRGARSMIDSNTLDIQFAPSVRVSPENITVNESADVLIHCHYEANPAQLLHALWYQDNEQLDVAGRPDKYGNGNVDHPSLFIKNVSASDSGSYTCRLANSIGNSVVDNWAELTVQYPPEVHVLMEPNGPVSEDDKVNVTLTCDPIQANPQGLDRVRWYLKGRLLKELPECNGNETLYRENSELCGIDPTRLFLEGVNREFHGNYSCEGMNEAGWGPQSAMKAVVVRYPPSQAFITYKPMNVIKGQSLELTCNLNDAGRPATDKVRWYRGGRLVPDVTSLTWKIEPVSLETESNFTCVPYNIEGVGAPADVDIDVLAKPFFITRPPNYQGFLMNSKEVSLTCRVECSPLCSIMWQKNGVPLSNTPRYKITSTVMNPDPSSGDLESVQSVLEWQMSQWPKMELDREKDNSNYTCVSTSNSAGPGVASHTYFRVEFPPERISVTKSHIQVVENGTPPRVACQAYSYPEPHYIWQREDETVSKGSVFYLSHPLSRDQAGEYTCIAENRHGKMSSTTFFDVQYKPECAIHREDEGSGEDAQIVLHCKATANPQLVDFRWRFGNDTLTEDIANDKLESRLSLPASASSLGTYYCYVNNTVGESIPCEIDVTGIMEVPQDNLVLISAIVAAAVLLLIIICIIIVYLCRRHRQSGKYPDSGNKKPSDSKDGAAVGTDEEPRQFYENLPFHGMAPPPNKNRMSSKFNPLTNSRKSPSGEPTSTSSTLSSQSPKHYQAQHPLSYQRTPTSNPHHPPPPIQTRGPIRQLHSPPTYSQPIDLQMHPNPINQSSSYYQKPTVQPSTSHYTTPHPQHPTPSYRDPNDSPTSPHHYSQPNQAGVAPYHYSKPRPVSPLPYSTSQSQLNHQQQQLNTAGPYNDSQNPPSNRSYSHLQLQYPSQQQEHGYVPEAQPGTYQHPKEYNKYAALQFNGPIVGHEIDV